VELCQCQGDAGGRRPQGGVSFRFRQHTRDFEARPTGKPGGPCLPRWVMHRDPLWAQSRKKEWSHPLGSLASDAHDASWSPAVGRTEYKVVGSSGGPRTRELRLGTADPPSWPAIRAQPSKRDTGVGGPQGRGAPPTAVALRAILDLRPLSMPDQDHGRDGGMVPLIEHRDRQYGKAELKNA